MCLCVYFAKIKMDTNTCIVGRVTLKKKKNRVKFSRNVIIKHVIESRSFVANVQN